MSSTSPSPAVLVRWLARVGSLASLAFLGLFLFGSSEPWLWPQGNEWLGFACFPVAVALGLLLAWRWESIGGLISLAGLVGFYLWEYSVSGTWAVGPWFLILTSPAILFLLACWLNQSPRGARSGRGERVTQT